MGYERLMYVHLVTVVPCFFMGTALLLMTKGTLLHRRIGRVYMLLMLFTAMVTVFMPARVGPTLLGHFGWIHSFSLLTIYTVPTAYLAIRRGDIKTHQRKMIVLYFGALVIAGAFTFFPGRYLHEFFFGG